MPYLDIGRRLRSLASGRRDRSRGQSLVEFALLFPILLLFVVVVIDFGRVYLGYVNLQNLARIAANYAANNPTAAWANDSDSKVVIYNRLVADDARATNCELQPDSGNNNPPRPTFPGGTNLGGTAQVDMTCEFGLITPMIEAVFGSNTISVSASAIFPIKSGGVAGISVVPGPPGVLTADFVGAPVSGTAPLDVAFTDLSVNGPVSWTWNFGDGNGSNDQSPTHTYAATGTYTVSLTVADGGGNVDTETKSAYIVVADPSVAEFSATPTTGSAPLPVSFQDLSGGTPTSWQWTFGDGGTSSAQNPSHTYTTPGTYDVTLTIDGPGGTATQTKAGYISVGTPQCVVRNVSDGSTKKVQATSLLEGDGFVVDAVGDSSNWKVRVQNPQGGLSVPCGSTVTIFQ